MTTRLARHSLLGVFAASVLLCASPKAAFVQSVWNGSDSNNWFTAGNWSSDVVPNSVTTDVVISSSVNNPVVLGAKASVENLTLMNNSVSLNITGVTDGLGIAGTSISNAGLIEIN